MNRFDLVKWQGVHLQKQDLAPALVDRRTLLKGGGALGLTGLALASGVLGLSGSRAAAQDATPEPSGGDQGGMPPVPEGATVVAQGLWNPGDLAISPEGIVFIAEQGIAGGGDSGPAAATPGADGSPVPAAPYLVPPQISLIGADGAQSVWTTETGGVGIGVYGGEVFVSTGGGSVGSGFAPLPIENTVSAVSIADASVRQVAELGPYEVANNPDGTDVNPNLYGLGITTDGTLYVADAGGNAIYQIAPGTGEFSLFAVVPNLTDLTGATPTAEEQAMQPGPRQPVPTSVAIGPDGTITVVLLSEAWNGPSVLDYQADGQYTVRQTDPLAMNVNAAYGPDGLLYVSQLTADFSGEQPAPGNVFRVEADGTVTPVVEGLFFPHGIVFDPAGNLYVATNSIISGPDAPLGMVLRFDGIAAPAA